MAPKPSHSPILKKFFAAAIEDAFYAQMGICCPELVGYLTNLLTDFVHVRNIYSLKGAGGETLRDVVDMIRKAYIEEAASEIVRERMVHHHVGDYTLYWSGLFPESLDRKGITDVVIDYCKQGKESYLIASDLSTEQDTPPSSTLRQLSEHFEDCAHGLTLARQNWDC